MGRVKYGPAEPTAHRLARLWRAEQAKRRAFGPDITVGNCAVLHATVDLSNLNSACRALTG